MAFQDHMLLWNHAALKVLDVRYAVIRPGDRLHGYQLPANVFLYSACGRAQLALDELEYAADKCFVCHAGKGTFLDIVHVTETFEYYMVYYSATMTLPCRRELLRLYKDDNPFQLQYGFAPQYPIPLFLRIEQMMREWQRGGQLDKFHVKALFYQFVYELMKQLQSQGGTATKPNVVAQAIRYIDEHYAEPVTLHSLASLFQCNVRQLQRLFKARLQLGPIDYLMQVRMQNAKAMLRQTDAPLQHIAESVGYSDGYYFSRMFKKYVGVSPLLYREQAQPQEHRRLNPSRLSRFPIGSGRLRMYSRIDDENHYQYKDGGVPPMYKNIIMKPTVGLMLCLLLLSACSAAPANQAGSGSGGTNQVASQPASGTDSKQALKPNSSVTIKHMKGELTLERRPEKIAVLDTQFVDQLIALNEQPAGSVITTADKTPFPEYLNGKLKDDMKLLGTKDEPNLEAVIAMDPDFIICTQFQEKMYDSLAKIAPTVMMDRNEDWRDSLVTIGKILGKEKEAQKVLSDYNEKTAKLKAELTAKMGGQTVALIRPRDNNIRIHTTAHRTAAILYKDLGLTPPKQLVNDKETSSMISLESLTELNADHYFYLTDDQFQKLSEQIQSTAVWKNLNAVKQNHVYPVNATLWIGYYGPIAMNLVVDQIAEALLTGK
ncbi:ABC-type Fe3+-hydroxamate transport system, periplasmic component [Paenibacillus sp. A3]|uniref:AraC family transcriptional regulator n=1 Tax=Paenibacillus sp. A3 TaxID=1337054 RepID=UPI0006D5A277|nr:AraC family transcriptional regulator [Paenibacillus sp. A3]KPV58772.1 ABC-type Fe3+-hydroxamate transport system, periplasmic component [Paenibacillus sp. A3]